MEPVRVLLADDHTLFRKGVHILLDQMQDIEVVGEGANGQEVVSQARELVPDVILMDIQMPVINGIEATQTILQENPHIGIILVTMIDDPESVFSGMRAGARGYVLKEAEPEELRRATDAKPPQPGLPYEGLTQRELEVLQLAADGLSNKEIAEKLVISEKTIKNHIANIFSKLQVNDRTHAILYALRKGLVSMSPEEQG